MTPERAERERQRIARLIENEFEGMQVLDNTLKSAKRRVEQIEQDIAASQRRVEKLEQRRAEVNAREREALAANIPQDTQPRGLPET